MNIATNVLHIDQSINKDRMVIHLIDDFVDVAASTRTVQLSGILTRQQEIERKRERAREEESRRMRDMLGRIIAPSTDHVQILRRC